MQPADEWEAFVQLKKRVGICEPSIPPLSASSSTCGPARGDELVFGSQRCPPCRSSQFGPISGLDSLLLISLSCNPKPCRCAEKGMRSSSELLSDDMFTQKSHMQHKAGSFLEVLGEKLVRYPPDPECRVEC